MIPKKKQTLPHCAWSVSFRISYEKGVYRPSFMLRFNDGICTNYLWEVLKRSHFCVFAQPTAEIANTELATRAPSGKNRSSGVVNRIGKRMALATS